ncbi:hypothetical protein I3760_01G145500 [Carya illinoinensis]|uniref:SANT domain-containing protein n=1 Tax=Carya illinoinensis TaxID=32201 RepID=A0A922G3I3_CARIL|nr:hypothetical protein I3760_01G145500 [Carya illinoinensis]KAG2727138.1 hypothetical protein I3760_01G145500 [Carya illinoinensis]KAG2727139.1 hypothetical protein I3760_01G145500 [Carya illinoinensis]KAG6731831.1 hypothetical protein I3842_01G148700 [Carya illinoinensis]KAG6731832.1 hypothetical protein I3842_01G148700 [Carya illinoinensis]
MDSAQVNECGDIVEDGAFDEQSAYPECTHLYDVFGEPQVFPRVGNEYQVEIPPQITGSDSLRFTKNPADAENTAGDPHDFLVGLSVPVMWISGSVENVKHEPHEAIGDSTEVSVKDDPLGYEYDGKSHKILEGSNLEPKDEPTNDTLDNGINLGELANVAMQQKMKNTHDVDTGKGYYPVPGSLGNSWSDKEEASLILGLYIFGKNLVLVKKFIGSKKMGDILSFYYGKFYRSDRYHRWAECRKMKSRRCIYGQRIFTGLRQQELFSRLLPHVSEECQNTLMEVSKAFGEGRMLLEEYVFTIKGLVGLAALVEAVGVGKGKQDLTGIVEPPKSTQVVPVRPEIPIGKACSTLTPLEIVNFLTGDFRLSKARSNDLFWEAVWPRLLARGWHSEQPNSNGYAAGSKHSLVFLIPGIKNFSRKKLVKGNHYFDSVSDVLSKVASDPGLLELEIGADDYRSKVENGWTDETKLDLDDFPDQQRHCYLKPRTPNHDTDVLKFTVVDTSLANEKPIKLRELRSLPSGVMSTSTSGSDSEDDRDSSEEPTDKSDSVNTSGFDREEPRATNSIIDPEFNSDRMGLESNTPNEGFQGNGRYHANLPVNIPNGRKTSICNDTQVRKATKSQLSQRMGPDNTNHLPPVIKRRRKLNACGRTDTNPRKFNILRGPTLKRDKPSGSALDPDLSGNVLSQLDSSQEEQTSTSLPKCSPAISCEGILGCSYFAAERPHEVPQPRTLIDLNLPIAPDAEDDEPSMTETKEHDKISKEPDDPNTVKPSDCVANSERQPNINFRRQSTRTRPPTTKALEALAFGYLDPKQKRKSRDASPRENSMLRTSRRARGQVRANENFGASVVDLKVEERANGVCHSNGDMMTKLQA